MRWQNKAIADEQARNRLTKRFFPLFQQSVDNFIVSARAYIAASHGTILPFNPGIPHLFGAVPPCERPYQNRMRALVPDSIRMFRTGNHRSPGPVLHHQCVYYAGHLGRCGHDGGTVHESVLILFLSQFDAPSVLLVEEEGHR